MKKPSSAREDIGYTTEHSNIIGEGLFKIRKTVAHKQAMKLPMPTFEQHLEALRQ